MNTPSTTSRTQRFVGVTLSLLCAATASWAQGRSTQAGHQRGRSTLVGAPLRRSRPSSSACGDDVAERQMTSALRCATKGITCLLP
jgi:hypothetical protein